MVDHRVVKDPDELKIAFDGPALASNRFFVTAGPGGIRIAFTEQWRDDAPPMFRCAAIVPIQDAIQLKDLLERSLKQLEDQTKNTSQFAGDQNGG